MITFINKAVGVVLLLVAVVTVTGAFKLAQDHGLQEGTVITLFVVTDIIGVLCAFCGLSILRGRPI